MCTTLRLTLTAMVSVLIPFHSLTASAADDDWPLQFDAYEYDFGEIDEADGVVSHTFMFSNISSRPVTIDYVSTSCGCTTASYPTDAVEPGEICEFTVNFNPARTDGRVFREIEVFVKGVRSCARMALYATVKPAPMGIRQLYPYLVAADVRTSTNHLAFGYIGQGHSMQKSVVIVNDSEKRVSLETVKADKNSILAVECPPSLDAGKAESVIFTYSLPSSGKYGTVTDTVWLSADGVRGEVPFVVSAIFTDDFTNAKGKLPKLATEPSYYDFGEQKRGKILKQKFLIRNDGEADLIVRAVEVSAGTTADLQSGTAIKPGQSVVMNAATVSRGTAGSGESCSVNLITNDPVRPRRELRLSYTVR
ncbi:MAG: DUF1573 domain-containing protein [Bacteroidaceae bacterium]|nr:DUF1573 domain-containing protein [Bacteroidaceae bacterium]